MTKSVAVLGCGPAGLLVAHAAKLSGWNFTIYSRKQRVVLSGLPNTGISRYQRFIANLGWLDIDCMVLQNNIVKRYMVKPGMVR